MKLYGSLNNRMEENRMYCDEIKVGTGMTEYSWSDRHPYEVVEVVDQTNVFVRGLDHIKNGEAYSNEWKLVSNENNPIIELKLKNGVWMRVVNFSKEMWMNNAKDMAREHTEKIDVYYDYCKAMSGLTSKEKEKVEAGKVVKKLRKFGNVSFGVAEYYYDYSF